MIIKFFRRIVSPIRMAISVPLVFFLFVRRSCFFSKKELTKYVSNLAVSGVDSETFSVRQWRSEDVFGFKKYVHSKKEFGVDLVLLADKASNPEWLVPVEALPYSRRLALGDGQFALFVDLGCEKETISDRLNTISGFFNFPSAVLFRFCFGAMYIFEQDVSNRLGNTSKVADRFSFEGNTEFLDSLGRGFG